MTRRARTTFSNYTTEDSLSASSAPEGTPPDSTDEELFHDAQGLVHRPNREPANETAALAVHKVTGLDGLDGLTVSITPPKAPVKEIKHVPCDIVLVIDTSGSMNAAAPVPGESVSGMSEENGLSVLDLTKHAARTILHTLDEGDRLAIVTFSNEATVLLGLVPMDEKNKATAKRKISGMQPQALTNLWHGIITGMKLFNEGNSKATSVPAIYILTDGAPNHLCPAQGYVTKLRSMKIPASIHTFGFGYSLRSGLLKSIAEIGGGGYAFIPDAGMIGTVFVHAVANLQSTFGIEATLTLKSQVPLVETMGTTVKQKDAERVDTLDGPVYRLTVSLGKIQYGQSRDIFLRFSKPSMPEESSVSALLQFSSVTGGSQSVGTTLDLNGLPEPPQDVIYHQARAHICSFLSSLFPIQPDGEHVYENTVTLAVREKLNELKSEFAAAGMEESLAPLLGDLNGQISIALSRDDYFRKWGCHYLSSLLSSHESQSCNSFKDPGPLEYGKNSPLFIKCRDELDNAFDNLPPPEPSRKTSRPRSVKMSKYNRSSNPCFAGFCKVVLANGNTLPLSRLRPGMQVLTPVGSRNVSAVLKTRVRNEQAQMCWVGNELLVTPYHPISLDGGRTWVFPIDVAKTTSTVAGGLSVYSVLLQPDKDERAHGIIVGDCLGITLGHGDVEAVASNDVTSHAFFGDYKRVARSMRRLPKDKNGVFIGRGVKRNRAGLVCGFKTSSKG